MPKRLAEEVADLPDAGDAKRIVGLERQLAAEKQKRERAEKRAREYERLIEAQKEQIEARAAQIFRSPQKATDKGKSWHRVIVPDTHGSSIDRTAASAFLRDLAMLRPKEIVW